eukprot:6589055-Prymnesium_polylepis.1
MLAACVRYFGVVDEVASELGLLPKEKARQAETFIYAIGRAADALEVMKWSKTVQGREDYHVVLGALAPRRTANDTDPDGMIERVAAESCCSDAECHVLTLLADITRPQGRCVRVRLSRPSCGATTPLMHLFASFHWIARAGRSCRGVWAAPCSIVGSRAPSTALRQASTARGRAMRALWVAARLHSRWMASVLSS